MYVCVMVCHKKGVEYVVCMQVCSQRLPCDNFKYWSEDFFLP